MNIQEYQKLASRTLISKPDFEITDKQVMIVWCAIGIADEASELIRAISKFVGSYDLEEEEESEMNDIDQLKKELGDVMWYLAALQTTRGKELKNHANLPTVPLTHLNDAVYNLNSYSGVILGVVKKGIFHQQGLDDFMLDINVSAMLTSLKSISSYFDFTIEEIMTHNIEKLKARYPEGWDPKRSNFKEGLAE